MASTSMQDVSQVRTPIHISGKPVEQVLNSIHYGSPELRCLLMDECSLIFECKVCRALFRDLPNFISHKRLYCTKSSIDERHVLVSGLPEEKVVIIQPQAPEDIARIPTVVRQAKAARPKLEETIQRIQSGELGKSRAFQVYTEAAEKLQKQKEGMKVATIRTTPIPTNKNAVFIDVNMASVNIHERQQQFNGGNSSTIDTGRGHDTGTVMTRKASEKIASATSRPTRHTRKSHTQSRHPKEPQQLLMDQLKEIQHKIRLKTVSQEKEGQQKPVQEKTMPQKVGQGKSTNHLVAQGKGITRKGLGDKEKAKKPQDTTKAGKTSLLSPKKEISHKAGENQNDIQSKIKKSETTDLKDLARQNLQSLLAKAEKTVGKDTHKLIPASAETKQKEPGKVQPKQVSDSKSMTAKAIALVKSRRKVSKSLICKKCNSIFATRKSLGFHMKIHHSPRRTFYPCPYCSSTFYYFYGITRHLLNIHSKSFKEIDGMRKQLRDISYTKHVPPAAKNDTRTPLGFRRSARAIAKKLATKSKSFHSDMVDMSPVSVKQLSKRKDKIISESSEKPTQVKKELGQTPRSTRSEASIGQVSKDEKKIENASKENTAESRSERLKNRHQKLQNPQGDTKHHPVQDGSDTSQVMLTRRHAASFKSVSENTNESLSFVCSKCQRSFGRKISYDSHVKNSHADDGGTSNVDKSSTPQTSEKQTASHSSPSDQREINISARTGSRNSPAAQTPSINANARGSKTTTSESRKIVENLDLGTRSRRQDGSNDSQNSISSRNSSLTPIVGKVDIRNRRSASVDRGLQHGQQRNRSLERGRISKRDSSVESTQSNVEGRSPRSKRHVHSVYSASPGQSPSASGRSQALAAQDTKDKSVKNDQHAFHMATRAKKPDIKDKNALTEKGELHHNDVNRDTKFKGTSPASSKVQSPSLSVTQLKTRTSSYKVTVVKNVGQTKRPAMISARTSTRFVVRRERKAGTGLSQKTYFSPRRATTAKSPLQTHKSSPHRVNLSPHNQSSPRNAPNRVKNTSQNVSPKKQETKNRTEISTSTIMMTPDKNSAKPTALSKVVSEKPETQDNVKSKITVELANISPKPGSKTQLDLGGGKGDVVESSIHGANVLQHSVNTSPEETNTSIKQNSDDTGSEASWPNVVSALSERPRRKRKVPSRNLDAEEMLSKIHNHSRDQQPVKKMKTTEIVSSDSLKHKSENGQKVGTSKDQDTNISMESADLVKNDEKHAESDGDDEESEDGEERGKGRGRVASNRIYVLEKSGCNTKKLKCYDLTFTHKFMDTAKVKCLVCGEKFTQWYNLRRHVIRNHLKWSRFMCNLCKFECYDRSECKTHILRTHRIQSTSPGSFIIDLVKQGSKVRSLKKNQTIKVKRRSESEAGNIYARPMVKKIPRLPQRVKSGGSSATDTNRVGSGETEKIAGDGAHSVETSGTKPTKNLRCESDKVRQVFQKSFTKSTQSSNIMPENAEGKKSGGQCESTFLPSESGSESLESKTHQDSSLINSSQTQDNTSEQLDNKNIINTTSVDIGDQESCTNYQESVNAVEDIRELREMSHESFEFDAKSHSNTQIDQSTLVSMSSIAATEKPSIESSSTKAPRSSRPFNISTRNSPRVFDIRPYRAESDDEKNVESENESVSKGEFKPRTEKGLFAKVVKIDVEEKNAIQYVVKTKKRPRSEKGTFIRKSDPLSSAEDDTSQPDSIMTDSSDASEPTHKDKTARSRNIFDNLRTQSISSEASNNAEDVLDNTPMAASINVKNSASGSLSTRAIAESASKESVCPGVHESKMSDLSHRTSDCSLPGVSQIHNDALSPQKSVAPVDEYAQYNQLAKSLIKLKKLGDQLSSSASPSSFVTATVTKVVPAGPSIPKSSTETAKPQPSLDASPIKTVTVRDATAKTSEQVAGSGNSPGPTNSQETSASSSSSPLHF